MRGNDHKGARFTQELPSPVPAHPADSLITPARAAKYRQVLARRSDQVAVVVEDCYDPHNATAVLRTCDALGIHRVHVVAGRNSFKVNPRVSQGAHRYLDFRVHRQIDEAYAALRADGFRIFVTNLGEERTCSLAEVGEAAAQGPVAVVFGSEAQGVSPEAVAGADASFVIPMQGFTESLNLSVSAAIVLYHLRQAAVLADAPGDVNPARQQAIYERWLRLHKGDAPVEAALAEGASLGKDRKGETIHVFGGPDEA